MSNFAIGVDLGGTNLRIAAVDEKGQLMEKVTLGTKTVLGRDHVLNDMCEAIRHASDKYKSSGELLGVGIGVPGIIDLQTGMVRESPNLPGWSDYPVRNEIEKRLGAPVILENDANVAAFGEKWLGAGRHVGDMRYPPATWRISMPWPGAPYSATSSSSAARTRDFAAPSSAFSCSASADSLTS